RRQPDEHAGGDSLWPEQRVHACGADVSRRRLRRDLQRHALRRNPYLRTAIRSAGRDANDPGSRRDAHDHGAVDDQHARHTADTLRGGWMHTGDGGYMDDDGFVFIVDRIKDMIITGGENVYSAEVENAIYQHPAVAMCAVIGVPDEQWGERVHAIVSLKPGQTVTSAEIVAHCRTLIAG